MGDERVEIFGVSLVIAGEVKKVGSVGLCESEGNRVCWVAEDGGFGGLRRQMEGSGERVEARESEGERVFEVRKNGGVEDTGGMVEFIEEKELTWREEKPWNVKEC